TRLLPSKAAVTTSAWKWSCVPVRSVTSILASGKAVSRRERTTSGLGMSIDEGTNVLAGKVNSPYLSGRMDRRGVWPDFRDAWIVADDGDIIVVDKPAGVSSQAADPERPDDVVTRLRAHLGGAYLGSHQRLDRDTSGLLVFARRKEANPRLAKPFE